MTDQLTNTMKKPPTDIFFAGGNIMVFIGSHPPEFTKDIVYSSLYGELVSSKRSSGPTEYWPAYVDTISKLQWITGSRESFRSDFSSSSLIRIIERNTGSFFSSEDMQALSLAVSQLEKLPSDSPAVKAFQAKLCASAFTSSEVKECNATNKNPIKTTVLLTIVRPDKTVLTLQVSFEASATEGLDILHQPLMKPIQDGNTNVRILISTLNERKYAEIRNTIVTKLGAKIDTDLIHVQELTDS